MKKLMLLLAVVLLIFPFTGCKRRLKIYTDGTISLTLPEGFDEKTDDEDYEYVLSSNDAYVMCSHADQAFLDEHNISDITLDEFTGYFTKEEDKLLLDRSYGTYNVFSYEGQRDGKSYYSMVGIYQTNDGFWLVNFICDNTDVKKYEGMFLEWAGKVTFKD